MLYMLLICYDPTTPPIASEQNLQPEHHKGCSSRARASGPSRRPSPSASKAARR